MKTLRLVLACAVLACAQDVLTNDSIVKMVKSGLGDSLIVNMIQSQPGKYALTADSLVKLKQQGVSDNVLSAMVNKGSAASSDVARFCQPVITEDFSTSANSLGVR